MKKLIFLLIITLGVIVGCSPDNETKTVKEVQATIVNTILDLTEEELRSERIYSYNEVDSGPTYKVYIPDISQEVEFIVTQITNYYDAYMVKWVTPEGFWQDIHHTQREVLYDMFMEYELYLNNEEREISKNRW